jgi:hypothetical protein
MNTNERDKRTAAAHAEDGDSPDDRFQDLLNGLERLAGNFDAQAYPGQAWPVARRRCSHRPAWALAASLAAAAAIAMMVVHFGWRSDIEPAPSDENAVAVATIPSQQDDEELAIPEILIVEDAESYSIIDMTSGVALVSYATKDSYCPACVVPLLHESSPPGQSMQPGTKAKKI